MDAKKAKELAESYSALSAAHAAFAAGEEGADLKLEEAKKKHDECEAKYAEAPEAAADTTDTSSAAAAYSVGEITPQDIASDPTGVLLSFQSEIVGLVKERDALKADKAAAQAKAKKAGDLATFSAFCTGLHEKGHLFDDTVAVAQFESSYGNEAQLKLLAESLKKSATKKETGPADISAIFSAEDVAASVPDPVKPAPAAATTSGVLNYSAEENKIGDDVLEAMGVV